jgi:ketosteroid isomerase-like protein
MPHINRSLNSSYKKFLAALLLCCVFSVSALAQSGNDTSARAQIRLLNKQMEDAFNSNDMQKVAAFYADDAEMVYDNGYTVKGGITMVNYWASLKDKGRGWKLNVIEIGGGGDLYFQLGKSDLKYLAGSKETTSVTNFVVLWKKQPDGSYKIFRDYITKTSFEKK